MPQIMLSATTSLSHPDLFYRNTSKPAFLGVITIQEATQPETPGQGPAAKYILSMQEGTPETYHTSQSPQGPLKTTECTEAFIKYAKTLLLLSLKPNTSESLQEQG